MGIAVERLLVTPDDSFICGICHDVVENPVVTPCLHLFCELCIRRWQACTANAIQTCPLCKQDLPRRLSCPPFLSYFWNRILVKCVYSELGCTYVCENLLISQHEFSCSFGPILCPSTGCEQRILQQDLPLHLQRDCRFVTQHCNLCGSSMLRGQRQNHHCLNGLMQRVFHVEQAINRLFAASQVGYQRQPPMPVSIQDVRNVEAELQALRERWDIAKTELNRSSNLNSSDLLSGNRTGREEHEEENRELCRSLNNVRRQLDVQTHRLAQLNSFPTPQTSSNDYTKLIANPFNMCLSKCVSTQSLRQYTIDRRTFDELY
eukprot:GILJ01009917.1.p1 GENE.GILJ01009917.1~~GILJ01009917.1.p1  ORF type:complete len:319 (-),score=16.44 GILJ01009917.1:305-1261(-)